MTAAPSLTMARSAIAIIGQLGSRFTATTWAGSPRPMTCWTAPEMPNARYSSGATSTPVVPIWRRGSTQPASVATLVAPSDAPMPAPRRASVANGSGPPRPAPPETMRRASARSMVVGSGGRSSTWVTSASPGVALGSSCPTRGGAPVAVSTARLPGRNVTTHGTVTSTSCSMRPAWSVTVAVVVPTRWAHATNGRCSASASSGARSRPSGEPGSSTVRWAATAGARTAAQDRGA